MTPATPWTDLPDDELLALRPSDLGLTLRGTWLERPIRRLRRELAAQGLVFRPHFWLSSEWFSPSGVPGVAIPFFLAHPRLTALEQRRMREVEGGTEESCLRLVRHEVGHAIDTAYRLHARRSWRETFGRWSEPYRRAYTVDPTSRDHVQHLDNWYAQSHPSEDFAESFAVWLARDWRREYAGWPALAKLEYVDGLMREVGALPPTVTCRERTEHVGRMRQTLRRWYARRASRYPEVKRTVYDDELRRLFPAPPGAARTQDASDWLTAVAGEVRSAAASRTGEPVYVVDHVLREMIQRCRRLDLAVGAATTRHAGVAEATDGTVRSLRTLLQTRPTMFR